MHDHVPADVRPVHVARQPIFDGEGALVGYELLFRSDADAVEASSNGAYATSQVLINACTEFGLPRLTGGRPAFVNLTREFLVGELPLPFGPDQAVLEILETVPVDARVMAGIRDLVRRGYVVALDDFVPGSPAERLLDLATYIKIDTLGVDPKQLAGIVAGLPLRPGQQLLAERIETPTDLAVARRLGFTLFQGYLLARPEVLTGRRSAPSRSRTLRLLGLLAGANGSIRDIAALVSTDAALCRRLLTAANTVAGATNRRVRSVADAAALLGTQQLRRLLTLMAVADLTGDEERATTVLIQARFCYEIAARAGLSAESAFAVGLLDAVCELTGDNCVTLADHLSLTPDLATALATGCGPLGTVVSTARRYQANTQDRTRYRRGAPDLAMAYLAAITWTGDLDRATSAA